MRLPPGAAPPPTLSARSWLVADVATGDVLAAHEAHRRLPPASTLKALFALTVLPRLSQTARHTVSERELTGIGTGSSLVGVKEDVTYGVADLWRGVFLHSGNDAVRVLAGLNGGWEATARQMEATARALGALDTEVVSPDGYDAPGQVSSAYDLAVFGREGLRDPDFARYCALPYAMFPADGWSYGIRNTNRLVTGDDGVARYPGVLGVKNGYTSRAGHTLIAAARRGGRTLVVTVMDPRSGGANAVYEEARRLLDWGFGPGAKVRPVGSLLPPATARPVPFVTPKAPAAPGEGVAAAPERAPAAAPAARAPVSAATSAPVSAPASGGAPAAGRGTPPASGGASTGEAGPSGDAPGAPGPAAARPAVRAAAAGGGPPPDPLVPVLLVGSACVAAVTLWTVRRRAAR
ncbi:D-alanyl-D-alanine carboxypeptidase [Streptomyces somaliensis]|uniref:D-alanyl-D-alanine carboxypeptidase family protein n=1 Tax=Streptomyces somaliensis TaxID=78355 RepID=UPI0020CD4F08|nr:serine hydrolase [Streptomyces somaliensis]MCP9945385.1 D-alanyl-D-alanine carboxypeptidase [Streptomyces somaliensis]MCP9974217.1 D-alanyl-D-alanine carboxypeptidase [Streptomyces somaliensis]